MESLILKKKVTSYNSSRLGKVLIDALKDKNLLEFQSIKKTQEILGDNKIDAEVPILKEAMEYAGYYWDNIHYKFYKLQFIYCGFYLQYFLYLKDSKLI